jgi:hypothetical protein
MGKEIQGTCHQHIKVTAYFMEMKIKEAKVPSRDKTILLYKKIKEALQELRDLITTV